jgi:tRNA(fMet)-specific endonuclease VapC
MNGRYLLDTNIIIALFANDAVIIEQIKDAGEVFIPSVVIGELYYGAQRSGRIKANTERVHEFATESVVLSCDVETARRYGEIKNELRKKGRLIPENDIWVAALALQYDLALVSRDEHFGQIPGLHTEAW